MSYPVQASAIMRRSRVKSVIRYEGGVMDERVSISTVVVADVPALGSSVFEIHATAFNGRRFAYEKMLFGATRFDVETRAKAIRETGSIDPSRWTEINPDLKIQEALKSKLMHHNYDSSAPVPRAGTQTLPITDAFAFEGPLHERTDKDGPYSTFTRFVVATTVSGKNYISDQTFEANDLAGADGFARATLEKHTIDTAEWERSEPEQTLEEKYQNELEREFIEERGGR